jgi:NADH-quinone oxidoreductase subunit H
MATALFQILIFPGFLFISALGLIAEYVDRKLCAKLQNRVGPPWYQPEADFIKLAAKEDIVPENADTTIFKLMPVIALTSVLTAFMYIPVWGTQALFSFKGDVIVVIYLLTIPTFTFFLGGWYSRSVF